MNINNLAINSDGIIFAGTPDGVFRSTNNGNNWFRVDTGFTNTFIDCISVNKINGYIFVGTHGAGIYRSTDNGDHWEQVSTGFYWSMVVDSSGNIFLAGGNYFAPYHIFRSTNNGNTWEPIDTKLQHMNINTVTTGDSGHIFACTNGGGILHSTDYGSTWFLANDGLKDASVTCLGVDAKGNIMAGTEGGGVYLSINHGINWSQFNIGLSAAYIYSLAINPQGNILIGTSRNDAPMYRFFDSSWTQIGLKDTSASTITFSSNGDIFVGNSYGIFQSTDGGFQWLHISAREIRNVASICITPIGDIFAGTGHCSIYRSTDYGHNWKQVYVECGFDVQTIKSIVCNSKGYIFAGTDYYGVLCSTDNGESWSLVLSSSVNSLVINSKDEIFAGSYGVFRSTNNGLDWEDISTGLTDIIVQTLAIDSNGYLFAGTFGGGVFRSSESTNGFATVENLTPKVFSLSQNYPNPFNPNTNFEFQIPKSDFVSLKVFNLLGKAIATVVAEELTPGTYKRQWNGSQFASGVYYYRLQTKDFVETKKLLLIR